MEHDRNVDGPGTTEHDTSTRRNLLTALAETRADLDHIGQLLDQGATAASLVQHTRRLRRSASLAATHAAYAEALGA